MEPDLWYLYTLMLKSRLIEEEVIRLWNDGKISGEMHLAIGEEAISAGIIGQLQDGDAIALDHRGTPQFVMRGVDSVLLLRELLGHSDGLCRGMGGHMHLFSHEHLAASSGIVGASAPAAVGFGLSAQYLRPGKIAVAFFGEGAMNQGMLMEALNLASVWQLPVLFVCKNNEWAITTPSESVTGGDLIERARSFGIGAKELDGRDVLAVWEAAQEAIDLARQGKGSSFLLAHCFRPEGHFLGDHLLRFVRHPVKEMKKTAGPLLKSATRWKGSSLQKRTKSLGTVTSVIGQIAKKQFFKQNDPLDLVREKLTSDKERLKKIEKDVKQEIQTAVEKALMNVA